MPGKWEWVLLLLVVLLLFGAKRLPEVARGIGRSLRILKTETQGLREDGPSQQQAATPKKYPNNDPAKEPTKDQN